MLAHGVLNIIFNIGIEITKGTVKMGVNLQIWCLGILGFEIMIRAALE